MDRFDDISPVSPPPAKRHPSIQLRGRRVLLERFTTAIMYAGGFGVMVAIALIFGYLLYVVLPVFQPAAIRFEADFPARATDEKIPLATVVSPRADWLAELHARGRMVFTSAQTGASHEQSIPLPPGAAITAVGRDRPQETPGLALGLSNGEVWLTEVDFESRNFTTREVHPSLRYPLGQAGLPLEPGAPVRLLAYRGGERKRTLAALFADGRLRILRWTQGTGLFDRGEWRLEQHWVSLEGAEPVALVVEDDQRFIYVADPTGFIDQYQLAPEPKLLQRRRAVAEDRSIRAMTLLAGGVSVVVGDSAGGIHQGFPVLDPAGVPRLTFIRSFQLGDTAITALEPEAWRKSFVAADASGRVGLFHATSGRVLNRRLLTQAPRAIRLSAQGDRLVTVAANGAAKRWAVRNPHPEISWRALWGTVWYENHAAPDFVWQTSAAESVSEPKYSLVPLVAGTFKAALYAMLVATPLAVMGGIYTAYFMASGMRRWVKPVVELMEALPTVILGFIGGVWLAPLVERQLPGAVAVLLLLPLAILGFALLWRGLPPNYTQRVPEGWHAVLLIPVITGAVWLALSLSAPLEQGLFGGNVQAWLRQLGVDYAQRNALIVGLVMGFAVIPTIFSLTEDAVRNVPRHLTTGSLALGATPWQTMTRVVLWTASPGIIAAVLIGLGRALGETMIVLMATGNTPILQLDPFSGMRALSANIAVEMGESPLYGTQFRILFLSALVLFVFTFVVNSLAEWVRHGLRQRYREL